MKPNLASIILWSAVLTLGAGTSASAQQLIQNGGFETGDFTGWTQSGNAGSTDVQANALYVHSGTYGVQAGPALSLGYLSQTFSTTPGQTYSLSLWLDSPNGETPNEFQVSWGRTVIFDQINLGAIHWTNLQFTTTATSSQTTLQIGFRNDPSFFGLDDISVTSLPVAGNYETAYTFTTLAGYPSIGSSDGAGSQAQFFGPSAVAVDSTGNIYVADTFNDTIRKIALSGVATTIAGVAGQPGTNDGVGSGARFNWPFGITVDSATNLYVADFLNSTIRKLTPAGTNWMVATLAGAPLNSGFSDGTGGNARFYSPSDIAVDSSGNLFVTDAQGNTIREVTQAGLVTTIAGTAGSPGSKDALGTAAQFNYPFGVAVDAADNLYVADQSNDTIRKLTPKLSFQMINGMPVTITNWQVSTIAGTPETSGHQDGINGAAGFYYPDGVAVDSATNLYVADYVNNTIRKITPVGANWSVSTMAGSSASTGSSNGTGTNALFFRPAGVAVDSAANVYVADSYNNLVRQITPAQSVTTLAGASGSRGGVDGTGSTARFNGPVGVAVDGPGHVYVGDSYNDTIRKVTAAGVVSTLAGSTGNAGQLNAAGSEASFNYPQGVAVDNTGNVYVADARNYSIRKVSPSGVAGTLAGGTFGDNNGTGASAQFGFPVGIAVDTAGILYVSDNYYSTIRKITPEVTGMMTNWVVSTIAGSPGVYGTNDGTGTGAEFAGPQGIAVDSTGNVYVADYGNYTIRMLRPVIAGGLTNYTSSTLAGSPGMTGSSDGSGGHALFLGPAGVAVDNLGNLYVTDAEGNDEEVSLGAIIRKIMPQPTANLTNWLVSTLGGTPHQLGSTDGSGGNALFNNPQGIAVDAAGNIYIADNNNNTIRKGSYLQYASVNAVPFSQPLTNTGALTVTLLPAQAGGQWRFPWEQAWRDSDTTATNLVQGSYLVEFRPVPGYLIVPLTASEPIPVSNGATNSQTFQYYPTITTVDTNSGGSSLTVEFVPGPPPGAFWQFLGSTNLLPSGYTTNLPSGAYVISFLPVTGFATPPNLSFQVVAGVPTVLQINYAQSQTVPAGFTSLPVPVPVGSISDESVNPFGFNGQLESDVGSGSGVAVQTNVVLTAAHLVFNDQTLSYVSQAYWFVQQETGVSEPFPLAARSWFVLSGYAAQRTNDVPVLGPDQSSPQSRNMDVAALFFQSPVADGGYGGYLPSDAVPNQWLASVANKMLVGYPVDGSQFENSSITPGTMYQTLPQPYPLTQASDPEVSNQQVYTSSWFLSYPGNSGGPLYVEFNGYYYPAGVYLGTLYDGIVPYASAVRAIDSNVVNLITTAAAVGYTGTNFSGGGVITIFPGQTTSARNPGYLILQLGPPSAVQAGAAWKLTNQTATYYSSANPSLQEVTSTNALVVQFKPIPGWNLPTNRSVTVIPGVILTNVATYTVTNPVLTLDLVNGLRMTGTTNTTYQIQSNSSLASGTWIPFKTNTLATPGYNLITNNPRPAFYRALWLTNSP